jgi:hypothetical protein
MNVLVVYESLFHNTHAIADAIADGIRSADSGIGVECLAVSEALPDKAGHADVLVVGGPTHAHGMSSRTTRKMGIKQETKSTAQGTGHGVEVEPNAEEEGLRDWFHQLPKARAGQAGAAFDTRADFRMAGGAAHGISRRLRRHGFRLIAEPEGFIIEDATGPLREGELDRASAWGADLVAKMNQERPVLT